MIQICDGRTVAVVLIRPAWAAVHMAAVAHPLIILHLKAQQLQI